MTTKKTKVNKKTNKEKENKEDIYLNENFEENIDDVSLSSKVENAYRDYAMSVLRGRSFPHIDDGLKSVHRRIIYAMNLIGLLNSVGFKKAARVVGDVIGKYHPHGDTAVYESMVIMSQSFKMRYPIIDGQGNWGAIDDPKSFAAMRYTECRLTPIANCFLRDLPYETVNFIPNFDEQEIEPEILPASLPFNLLNGTLGIGVGLSTDYPSHNLVEVVDACIEYLKRPTKTTLETVIDIIKGPDLATGGQLLHTPEEIKDIYRANIGPFKIRGKYKVIEHSNKKGDWSLGFYEFPYDVSPEKVLEDINKIINPDLSFANVKGKKISNSDKKRVDSLTKLKLVFANLIANINNDSDKNGPLITIKNKNKDVSPEELAEALFQHTELQKNIRFETINIKDRKPVENNIFENIVSWCNFRLSTMKKRFVYLLKKANARLHILDGRLLIIDNLDAVIHIIRNSEDPKTDLIKEFKLSEIQAEDIVNLKLISISKLAYNRLTSEKDKLLIDIKKYTLMIDDEKSLRKEAIKELEADKKEFGDERRTTIQSLEDNVRNVVEDLVTDKTSDENIAVALSSYGWLAWKAAKQLNVSVNDFEFKNSDSVKRIVLGNRAQNLLLIDHKGKSYGLNLTDLVDKKGAEATSKWFKSMNRMVEIIIPNDIEKEKYLLSTSDGYGFITTALEINTRMSGGKNLISSVSDDTDILRPILMPENPTEKQVIVALSSANKIVAFPISNMKEMAKGKGVAIMGYGKGEKVLSVGLTNEKGEITLIDDKKQTVILTWKDIKKVLGERKSTAKGKVLNKTSSWLEFVNPEPISLNEQEDQSTNINEE